MHLDRRRSALLGAHEQRAPTVGLVRLDRHRDELARTRLVDVQSRRHARHAHGLTRLLGGLDHVQHVVRRPAAVKPIGFWLKHLDRLVEESFDRAVGTEGIARRHWQAMSVLDSAERDTVGGAGNRTEEELRGALSPFPTADAITVDEVVADLVRLEWVSGSEGHYALTASGREAFGRLGARVQEMRDRLVDGLAPDDYSTTVRVLGQMAANLDR